MCEKLLALIETDREELENRTCDLDHQNQQIRALLDEHQQFTAQHLRLNAHAQLTLQSQLHRMERRLTRLETTMILPTDKAPANS